MNRNRTLPSSTWATLALPCLALLASPALSADETAAGTARFERHLKQEGVAVDVEVAPLREGGTFREGEPVLFRFHVTDTNTGQPYSSLYPAAWMDRLPDVPEENPDSCKQKVESFVGGTLLAQAELDLNVYYVLALNDDATISVVDPLFGFGSSKLLTMAFLEAPGHDWVLTEDQRLLFVSMPEADAVAAISTADWKVITNIETGPNPGRLALQPDGEYLWAAYRDPKPGSERSGVTAIEVETLRRAADVETGNGDHDLVLDDDGRLYVTDPSDGAVSVVDTGALEVIRRIETAAEPAAIAYTPAGQAVYVTHRSGWIIAIDADRLEVTARIEAEPGLGDIRFVPETRLALAVNPEEDVLHIIDAAARKIVQTGDMEDEPDQIGLSDELAYVRHRKSEHILMIPLDEIGREGTPVPVIDFPGGQRPAGGHATPTPARGIVQAPGATAVLVANPGDEAIYYYKEGMAAPMGHFKNYDREARAVMVVDRSLREVAPGTYETAVTLRRSGEYDLAFFLDSPRIVHCFDFQVAENPELEAERQARERPFEVRYRLDDAELTVGREETVRFQLVDSRSDTPQGGREDVEVLTFLAPGIWQKRHVAEPVPAADGGEEGLYEIRFTPPRSGVYYIFVQSHGLGFGYQRSPYVALKAVEAETVANTDADAPEALKEE